MSGAVERFLAFRRAQGRTPPLEHRTVEARGLRFAVHVTPPVPGATPLVCVNGGMLFSYRLLWPALSPLARRRQLVLYDQRGRGASQAPPGARASRIEYDAGDVGAIRAALGIPVWDVLGHSWGGGIALLGAAMDQAGTRRIVTVDAVGPTSDWMEPLHAAALARLRPDEREALGEYSVERLSASDPAVQSDYAQAMYPAWFAHRELADYFAAPRGESATGAAVLARLRREGYDWRDRLRALDRPVLVIHGEQDALPARVALEHAELLPHARLALVSGAGHMPFWEAPERFFALVEDFLTAPAASASRPPP